ALAKLALRRVPNSAERHGRGQRGFEVLGRSLHDVVPRARIAPGAQSTQMRAIRSISSDLSPRLETQRRAFGTATGRTAPRSTAEPNARLEIDDTRELAIEL